MITAQQIRDSQAPDLPSLLSREAGLQITQSGGVGSATGMFLRGTDTRQTLVVIDGVPMTKQDATGTVSIEHMILYQIDRVEIVRGNVSSIYGSGAVGGVIQIFTRAGSGAPGFSGSVEAGTRNTQRISASARGGDGGLRYGLVVSDYATRGFSSVNTSQSSLANSDRDGYRNQSVNGSIAKSWSDDLTTREHSTTTTRNYYQTKTQVAEWSNEIVVSPQWLVTAGANRQWQRFSSEAYGSNDDYRRSTYSVFGGLQGTIERHQWQFNARQDDTGGLSATTGYAGYGFKLDQNVKLIANLSNAFSAPPLGYLYGAYGNSALKPEYASSVEAGI